LNYFLARRNRLPNVKRSEDVDGNHADNDNDGTSPSSSSSSCYLGLHGHVLNFEPFAEFHPGLIEIVLKDCGQDASVAFENLPHSKGARAIAQRLLVMVHLGTCRHSDNSTNQSNELRFDQPDLTDRPWGLLLLHGKSGRKKKKKNSDENNIKQRRQQLRGELRSSNSRPLPPMPSSKSFLPSQPFSRRRQLPTLARIRQEWDNKLDDQLGQLERLSRDDSTSATATATTINTSNTTSSWLRQSWQGWSLRLQRNIPSSTRRSQHATAPLYTWTAWRVYYDPLNSKWVRWKTD